MGPSSVWEGMQGAFYAPTPAALEGRAGRGESGIDLDAPA